MTTLEQTKALPVGTWTADTVHSEIGFRVDYMAGAFRGTFASFTAEVVDGKLHGTADVSSVQVKDPNLEAHLQSPDFFDAGNEITVHGEITIKGQTHPIELTGTIGDPIADPYGNERFGLELEGKIDRTAFGIDWNNPLPSGEPALANDVTLVAQLQLVKAA